MTTILSLIQSQALRKLNDIKRGVGGYLSVSDNKRASGPIKKIFYDIGVCCKGEGHIQTFKERKVRDFTRTMTRIQTQCEEGSLTPKAAVEAAKQALKTLHQEVRNYRHNEGAKISKNEVNLGTNGNSKTFYTDYRIDTIKTPKPPGKLDGLIKTQLQKLGVPVKQENLNPIMKK